MNFLIGSDFYRIPVTSMWPHFLAHPVHPSSNVIPGYVLAPVWWQWSTAVLRRSTSTYDTGLHCRRWENTPCFWCQTYSCRSCRSFLRTDLETRQETHSFNGCSSGTTRVSRYQKGKANLDFTKARDSEWQWHQLGHMQVCTSLQTDKHASTPPLSFYRPDALPAAQPTASKHWKTDKKLRLKFTCTGRTLASSAMHFLSDAVTTSLCSASPTRLSTWHCPRLLLSVALLPRAAALLLLGARSISPARGALSSKPAARRCCGRISGATDGRTHTHTVT